MLRRALAQLADCVEHRQRTRFLRQFRAQARGLQDFDIRPERAQIYNCFPEQDHVLKYLYEYANGGMSQAIGYHGIDLKHRKIENLDCSDLVDGHTKWKDAFGSILSHVND